MIKQAIEFILSRVDEPALAHPDLDRSIRPKVSNTKVRIQSFKKIGDLYHYMERFSSLPKPGQDEAYKALKSLGLETYEDIFEEFKEKFKNYIQDIMTLDDFVIGNIYSSWDISNFAKVYDNLQGIYLIGQEPYKAIFIKVTLQNGKYPNEWIEYGQELKYFMKSISGKFDANYKVNKAIINSGQTPIYVFIKEDTQCKLVGIFKYLDYYNEPDDSKWFRLEKMDSFNFQNPVTFEEYHNGLEKEVKKSRVSTQKDRLDRLAKADKKPQSMQVVTMQYKRNSDVIAEVLARAKGFCEDCKSEAPFIRASDQTPYLEVHHIIPLSKGGDDTIDNAKALCPNCHRRAHFG